MTRRWVTLKTPWWQCIHAAIPYLKRTGDYSMVIAPEDYRGPVPGQTDVVMAPHRAPRLAPVFAAFSDRVKLYETENLLGAAAWRFASEQVRKNCPAVEWLNYSSANAAVFGDTYVPLRRRTSDTSRPPAARDFDVLHVGSMNPRRDAMITRLRSAGVRVCIPDRPVFDQDLAALEARSRVLLNVHYYTPGIFEAFRVVPAIHRGTPVISETSLGREGAEWCAVYDFDDLADGIRDYLKETDATR
jgi:hypothetical protein